MVAMICGCVFGDPIDNWHDNRAQAPNNTRTFSGFHLEAGNVVRTSLGGSDFSLTKTVLFVVVLYTPGGVGERALPYLQ
jgi:hypothetical protein